MHRRNNNDWLFVLEWTLIFTLLACFSFMASGCSRLPKINLPGGASVIGNRDAGTPATLSEGTERTEFRIPANSKVTLKRSAPLPTEGYVLPEITTMEFVLPEPMDFTAEAKQIQASTGTIDTSIAKERIAVAERRWLLFTAIGCGIAGLIARSLVPAWPAISNGLLMAAVFAGLAWKMAEIPAWLWGVVLIGVAILVAGYKRAEWDKDGNGTPDFLQKK